MCNIKPELNLVRLNFWTTPILNVAMGHLYPLTSSIDSSLTRMKCSIPIHWTSARDHLSNVTSKKSGISGLAEINVWKCFVLKIKTRKGKCSHLTIIINKWININQLISNWHHMSIILIVDFTFALVVVLSRIWRAIIEDA